MPFSHRTRAALAGVLIVFPTVSVTATIAQEIHARLRSATVRIRVDEGRFSEYGSGTIVERAGSRALVVTCAHVFEINDGKGPIDVTVFSAGGQRQLTGRVLALDFDLDVALVRVDGIGDVATIELSRQSNSVSVGQQVTVAGCDEGGSPATWDTHVTAVNRFFGRPNLEVAEVPRDGRSGGAVISADGRLIGVCNGIDPEQREGIYAGIAAVHKQLARIGEWTQAREAVPDTTGQLARQGAASPRIDSRPRDRPAEKASQEIAVGDSATSDVEVICIVRSTHDASPSKVYVLKDASPELLRAIQADGRRQR
ncbi:MAG: serine protease [Pirellulales bacterium]